MIWFFWSNKKLKDEPYVLNQQDIIVSLDKEVIHFTMIVGLASNEKWFFLLE